MPTPRVIVTLVSWLLLAGATWGWQTGSPGSKRQIAITIDDLPTVSVMGDDFAHAERVTGELVAALQRHRVPAIGFVNERKLQTRGQVDPRRVAFLQRWIDAGLELGNHTFSHPDLHNTSLEQFKRDVLDGEKVTRPLLKKAGREPKYFRHPFLHTGRSEEIRRQLERFLATHGYEVAPVTVDNYDYIFAAAFDRVAARGDESGSQNIADAYMKYMEDVVSYFERQSVAIVGREIAQTLLLHASTLNATTFDRLAAMLARRGYRFVSLGEALRDPAYHLADTYYGPAGITWLHRWALTKGLNGNVFAGEPAVPPWIERASHDGVER